MLSRASTLKEAAFWLLTTGIGFLIGTGLMLGYLALAGKPLPGLLHDAPERFLFANALLLIGALLFPSLIMPVILRWDIPQWYGLSRVPGRRPLIAGPIMLITLYPFLMGIEYYLKQWLPEAWTLSGMQLQLRELYESLLQVGSSTQWMLRILWVAVVPAIAEEFYFRGLTQQLFQRWTQRPGWAIFLSAFLFAALHMQVEGFVSRWMIGMLLGYLFWKSHSIWVPVAVHLFNNMLILSLGWAFQQGWIPWDPASDIPVPWALMGLSLVVTMLIDRFYLSPPPPDRITRDWTKVYETTDPYWARILEGHLQSLSIPTVLINKRDSSYGFGHLELWVPHPETDRARNVINEALRDA